MSDFTRTSCTYGGACAAIPGAGNGLLYSYIPSPPSSGGGSQNTESVIPSTYWFDSQAPIMRAIDGSLFQGSSGGGNTSSSGAESGSGLSNQDTLDIPDQDFAASQGIQILNGWITIDRELVRLFKLMQIKI